MAVNTVPIQMRRGNESDFDNSKMLPGEFAVSLDQKKLRIAFGANDSKEVAFKNDLNTLQAQIEENTSDISASSEQIAVNSTGITGLSRSIGDLSNLETLQKSNIVEAINETLENAGASITVAGTALVIT